MEELTAIIWGLIMCVITLAIFGLLLYRIGFGDGVNFAKDKAQKAQALQPNRPLDTAKEVEKMLEELPDSIDSDILKARYQNAKKRYFLGLADMAEFDMDSLAIKKQIQK
jgi:hypothetical protein